MHQENLGFSLLSIVLPLWTRKTAGIDVTYEEKVAVEIRRRKLKMFVCITYLVLICEFSVIINVDLDYIELIIGSFGMLLEVRSKHLAGAAPTERNNRWMELANEFVINDNSQRC